MGRLPPNVRTRSPRLVSEPSRRDRRLDHAKRWGLTPGAIAPELLRPNGPAKTASGQRDSSPTPPPVAVRIAPEPAVRPRPSLSPRPTAPTSRARALPQRSRWIAPWRRIAASLPALAIGLLCAASALVWRFARSADTHAAVAHAAAPPLADTPPAIAPGAGDHPPLPARAFTVSYEGHVRVDGGVMVFPSSFRPTDGAYDLVLHFHGDVEIVRESFERAGINAAVAIINRGTRSTPYRNAYQAPGRFEQLLEEIDAGIARRGFSDVKLRRLALTAWSAGYGAIESILEHRRAPHAGGDPLDAIVVLDGVHCGFIDGDARRLNERSVLPFLRATQAAAKERLLFTLTHSQIDPREYAGTERTAKLLLSSLGTRPSRKEDLPAPPHLTLAAASKSIGRDVRLEPISDTRVGTFRVRGFKGTSAEHHAAHLIQMASVGLEDLATRWVASPERSSR